MLAELTSKVFGVFASLGMIGWPVRGATHHDCDAGAEASWKRLAVDAS